MPAYPKIREIKWRKKIRQSEKIIKLDIFQDAEVLFCLFWTTFIHYILHSLLLKLIEIALVNALKVDKYMTVLNSTQMAWANLTYK